MSMSSCFQVPEHLHAVDEHPIEHHPPHCLSHTPQHFHNKVPIIIITKMHFSHARNPRFQQTQKKRVDCNLNRTFPISIPSQHDNVKNGEKKLRLGWGNVEEEEKTVPSYHLHYFPLSSPSPSPTSNSGRSSSTLRTWIRSDLIRTTAQVSEDQWPGQMSCKERLSLKTFSYFNVILFREPWENARWLSLESTSTLSTSS